MNENVVVAAYLSPSCGKNGVFDARVKPREPYAATDSVCLAMGSRRWFEVVKLHRYLPLWCFLFERERQILYWLRLGRM